MGARRGAAPKGWGPKGGRPKILRFFFFSLPPEIHSFFSLSGGLLVEFWRRDAQKCAFGVLWLRSPEGPEAGASHYSPRAQTLHLRVPAFKNTKIQREDPQREKKDCGGSGRSGGGALQWRGRSSGEDPKS